MKVGSSHYDSTNPTLPSLPSLPIGSIVAWDKSRTNTPGTLPANWVECNGQLLNIPDSPYNGQYAPDLNNNLYDSSRGRYLRGGLQSGLFNESTYYSDNGISYYPNSKDRKYYGAAYGRYFELDGDESVMDSFSLSKIGSELRFQTAAMTVVWILRVK